MTVEDQLAALFGEVQTYYYIIKDTPASSWRSAIEKHKGIDKKLPCEWSSAQKAWYYGLPLTKATIKSAYKNAPDTGKEVGRRPATKNNYVAFDVDSPIEGKRDGSKFHPDNSLVEWSRLIMLIKDRIGVNIVPVRSSKSGGYHIYVFFDQWISSDRIAHRVKEILVEEGIEIAQGQLEIFPNIRESDKALFNGLRLPCLTDESYVIDPFTLERVGGREAFVELAAQKNTVDILLGREKPSKPVLVAVKPERKAPIAEQPEEVKPQKRGFNLYKNLKWTETNRSNKVIGAHVAYVIEQMGLTNPEEIEQTVWERLHEYGYKQNASATEQKDRRHVRRWIAHRLKKGDVAPLAKVTGVGDTRINEQRSEDSKFRFKIAIEAAEKAGMTFPSWNQMFKWVNRWLSQQYLATIGGSTWAKLKDAAQMLLKPNNTHTVEQCLSSVTPDSGDDQGFTSPSKPAFKSVFMPTVLELGQKFVDSVAQVMGGDRTYAPKVIQYLLDTSPPEALVS